MQSKTSPVQCCLFYHVRKPSNHQQNSTKIISARQPRQISAGDIRQFFEPHYKPESICSTMFSPVHADQSRQVCATVEGSLIFLISLGYDIAFMYKPPDMCHATWQWKAI